MTEKWLTADETLKLLTRKSHIFIPQKYLIMMVKKRKIHTKRTGTYSKLYWGPDVQKYKVRIRV